MSGTKHNFKSLHATIVGLFSLFLAGCGFGGSEDNTLLDGNAWRQQAEFSCATELSGASAYFTPLPAISGPGSCGLVQPFEVHASIGGAVQFQPAATLGCPMIASLQSWLEEVVQPAARQRFRDQIVSLRVISSYSCRTRNNRPGARMSEHSYGNAIDIAAFTLGDGRVIEVEEGWHGRRRERGFLHDVHEGSCARFATVIGPDGDAHHRDHFHLDLARHGSSGTYTYCK